MASAIRPRLKKFAMAEGRVPGLIYEDTELVSPVTGVEEEHKGTEEHEEVERRRRSRCP